MSEGSDIFLRRAPVTFSDRVAWALVLVARFFADAFFAKRYGHRAVVLETIAAIPGMVGAFLLHLRALRRIADDHGWIRQLLDEAENERVHLMVYVTIASPSFFERLLIVSTQFIFLVVYACIYMVSTKTGHRIVGYLEEEAVVSYTAFLAEIDKGLCPNPLAPEIARKYWKLPLEATLRDVVLATRADEIRHRDANHRFADELAGSNMKGESHAKTSLK